MRVHCLSGCKKWGSKHNENRVQTFYNRVNGQNQTGESECESGIFVHDIQQITVSRKGGKRPFEVYNKLPHSQSSFKEGGRIGGVKSRFQ